MTYGCSRRRTVMSGPTDRVAIVRASTPRNNPSTSVCNSVDLTRGCTSGFMWNTAPLSCRISVTIKGCPMCIHSRVKCLILLVNRIIKTYGWLFWLGSLGESVTSKLLYTHKCHKDAWYFRQIINQAIFHKLPLYPSIHHVMLTTMNNDSAVNVDQQVPSYWLLISVQGLIRVLCVMVDL